MSHVPWPARVCLPVLVCVLGTFAKTDEPIVVVWAQCTLMLVQGTMHALHNGEFTWRICDWTTRARRHASLCHFTLTTCYLAHPAYEIFRIGSLTGKDDRSRDVAMATSFCLFNSTQFFRHNDQCVINFVQSSTTGSTVKSVLHEVDRRRFLLTTPVHRGTSLTPCERTSPLVISPFRHFPDTRVPRDKTISASAALDAREPFISP